MFNANNPFNQAKDYDFNYQTWKHRQEYGHKQMTPLPNNTFTSTPLRTEEEKRNYIYNVGVMQKVLKGFKEHEKAKSCYMMFDGSNLNLYNQGQLINSLKAMSGQPEFQHSNFQTQKDGPIPEGEWYTTQNDRQTIDPLNAILGEIKINGNRLGNWKGGLGSWGLRRTWLYPENGTDTYNRNGFSIHGGKSLGSAGCIDISGYTDILKDYLDSCQQKIPLTVKYPKIW